MVVGAGDWWFFFLLRLWRIWIASIWIRNQDGICVEFLLPLKFISIDCLFVAIIIFFKWGLFLSFFVLSGKGCRCNQTRRNPVQGSSYSHSRQKFSAK